MFAKIRETTLAADEEISRNIVGLARTCLDIFGATEEEVSNAVKAEIENKKKNDEQPKHVISDGHTANQAMSHNAGGEDPINDAMNKVLVRPLPLPPGHILNILRPPNSVQYSTPTVRPPPPPPVQMMHMANRPPNIPVPPPPGSSSNFTPLGGPPRPFVHMSQPGMHMVPPPPPPLPEDEPEPKWQRLDDSMLIPEDQFLAQHSEGTTRISICVPNAGEGGNLKGQVLDITVLLDQQSEEKEKTIKVEERNAQIKDEAIPNLK
ncbi:hypothetical protein RD792_007588 [Penstemon davidsonii]|uniref:Uncharacterized protein n=1 Tax=Penstemon davidsonii TaxID=160366 RepID=A0ABR0D6V7_9LAMI|nr:hypothetical protein RD792_007588 [Penstemon davidsonii]